MSEEKDPFRSYSFAPKQKEGKYTFSRYTESAIQYQSKKTKGVISNAVDNCYPEYLDSLYNNSVTHKAIIDTLVRLTVGKGLRASNPSEQSIIDQHFPKKKVRKIAFFKKIHEELTLELVPNKGRDTFAQINVTSPSHWRIVDLVDDTPTDFRYKTSWLKEAKCRESEDYPAFDPDNPFQYDKCLFYRYNPGTYNVPYGRPSYTSGDDPIEMEIGIYMAHNTGVQNGMTPSMILVKQTSGDPEKDREDAKNTQSQMAGPATHGKMMVVYTEGGTTQPPDIISPSLNGMDKVYETLYEKAEIGIVKAHTLPSQSIIAGLNIKPSGFSSPVEEMAWAKEQLIETHIEPERDDILEELKPLFRAVGIKGNVEFYDEENPKELPTQQTALDKFIELGESEEGYESIDVETVTDKTYHINAEKIQLNAVKLATVPSSSWQKESEQDTPLFKVRYKYAGDNTGERDFCRKLLSANKVYRMEDIEEASTQRLNPGFGPGGKDTYDIWLYKGGPNCKHFWERHIYMRKDNRPISVTEAQRIIRDLPVDERDENRLIKNDLRVAKRMEDQPNHGYINAR